MIEKDFLHVSGSPKPHIYDKYSLKLVTGKVCLFRELACFLLLDNKKKLTWCVSPFAVAARYLSDNFGSELLLSSHLDPWSCLFLFLILCLILQAASNTLGV